MEPFLWNIFMRLYNMMSSTSDSPTPKTEPATFVLATRVLNHSATLLVFGY